MNKWPIRIQSHDTGHCQSHAYAIDCPHKPLFQICITYLTCGINSLPHSVKLIVFALLLVHLILRISPHHSHHLRSHHLSFPRPFTPHLKLISFTNPFLRSHSYSSRTAFKDLNLYCIKGALAFVCFSFFFWLRVLDKATQYSAFDSTLNSAMVSYHITRVKSPKG